MKLPDGAFILGLMASIGAICSMIMLIYLIKTPDNARNLKSVLLHLVGAWFLYYSSVGVVTLWRSIFDHELIELNELRLIVSSLIILQLTAMYRIYIYVKKK